MLHTDLLAHCSRPLRAAARLVTPAWLHTEQQDRAAVGALAGGFGGAVPEIALTGASRRQGLRAGAAGAGIGALIGYMLSDDHYMTVVDVRAGERGSAACIQISTDASSGSGSITGSSSIGQNGWRDRQTRVVGEVAGHHLVVDHPTLAVEQNIAGSIAGNF